MKSRLKHSHQWTAIVALMAIVSGCASSRGFNRTSLREDLADKTPVVTDAEIQKTLALKPQLPKPFKLGVYFKEPEGSFGSRWNWGDDNKQKIFAVLEQFKNKAQISEVISVSPSTVTGKGTDLKALRLAAAEHGADALLVVSGVKDNDTYTNGWGWTYIALVTALFVPATETDILFMGRAAMWDVRNQYLYFSAESESVQKATRPAAFDNDRELTEKAKSEALDKLREEMSKMFTGLKDKKV